MDQVSKRSYWHSRLRVNGRNRQSWLLAPAEQELFGYRGRASTENPRALICQVAALNLGIAIDDQQLAGGDVAGSGQAYAALSSAFTITLVDAACGYGWSDPANDRGKHPVMHARPADTADDLLGRSLPADVLGLSQGVGLPNRAGPTWGPDGAGLPKLVLPPQQGRA